MKIRRWFDWRSCIALAAVGFVALFGVVVISNVIARNRLYSALVISRRANVDLGHRVDRGVQEVINNNREIGRLIADVNALRLQVIQLRGNPVVPEPTTTPTGTRSSTTTTQPRSGAAPTSSQTTTTTQPSEPTTTTTRQTCVSVLCLKGTP